MASRRRVLQALACLPMAGMGLPRDAQAKSLFPDEVTLFVAGPSGGWLDSLSRGLVAALRRALPAGTMLGRTQIGGVDGVTGANRFAVQTNPDGSSALLMPGATPLAWLVGDARVHFDPAHWLPILAQVGPAFVLGRADAPPPSANQTIRVAGGSPTDPAIAAMLAFDLLGARIEPVLGLDNERVAKAALVAGRVDAVLVRDSLDTLPHGTKPIFSLGLPAGWDDGNHDPGAPDVPSFDTYAKALGRSPLGPLAPAWRCAAAAAQLRYALVLPALTPPATVAQWRAAGSQALASPATPNGHVVQAGAASEVMEALNAGGPALLDLRGWLAKTLGWQPS